MSSNLPAIIKAAESLLDAIERAAPAFPKKYRYTLGQDIRSEALRSVMHAQYAMISRGEGHTRQLQQLIASNDRLKILMGTAHRNQCYRSAGQFEDLARAARCVGRQAGGLYKASKQHPHGQSAAASVPPAASRDTEYSRHPTRVHA